MDKNEAIKSSIDKYCGKIKKVQTLWVVDNA